MPNIPPDLTDELAVRNYLARNNQAYVPIIQPNIGIQNSTANLFKLPVFTEASLSAYVKGLVKDFDDSLQATVREVDNALEDINSKLLDEGTLLKKVEESIELVGSDLNASVRNESLVAISESGDWATSQSVSELSSNVANNYATTTVIADTYATQDEVGAIYGVTVEANGHVSGYKSIATGTSSIFQIYAEKFAVSSSATEEGYSPFQIDTVNHKINMTADVAIDGSLLVAGTITAAQIAASTITASKIAASTITANEIAASTITGAKIAAATIVSSNMATNILLVNAYIQSSNYSWNAGVPIGFGMWSTGDPTSGQGYNIIGGKLYGGEITGTTINASTINIRNLNLVNDNNATVDPFFTVGPRVSVEGTDPRIYTFATDMYTWNSTSTSTKKTVGTTGTKVFLSELDTTYIWAPSGYLAISASDNNFTLDVDILVGTTTVATRTSFSNNTDYDIGGFVFRLHYDTAQAYNYTFCIKTSSNDISISSTSSSPISIRVSVNWRTSAIHRNQGFAMLVSNL